MKAYLYILWLLPFLSFGQYPMTDNFTAIGGANQWYKDPAYSTPSTMGVDGGYLCYNITGTYANNTNYSFRSPDYTGQFSADNCPTITVSFNVIVNKRNDDDFGFFIYNGGWTGYGITTSGTYTITLPPSTQYFSFDLYAGNNGSLNGRYIHIDWFKITCDVVLPITLISFEGTPEERCNQLKWVTASEQNNDYFTLEKTLDGKSYEIVTIMNGAGNSNSLLSYHFEEYQPWEMTYYRLKQTDYDGKFVYSDLISVYRPNKEKKVLRIINILGQEVDDNYNGIKIYYFTDGSFIRKM